MKNYYTSLVKLFGLIKFILFSAILSFCVIVFYNKAVKFNFSDYDITLVTSIVLIVFILLFSILTKVIIHFISNKAVNFYDILSNIIALSIIISIIILVSFGKASDNSLFWLYGTLVIFISLIIFRIIYINKKDSSFTNVIDLKDIIEDKISKESIKRVYVDECAVHYDLLKRDSILFQITDTLENLNPKKKFVLSIEGEWGSGKTTLLNIVKSKIKSENKIIVDGFEPWHYNDEVSMLKAMMKSIYEKIDIGLSRYRIQFLIKKYIESVFSRHGLGFLTNIAFEEFSVEESDSSRIINDYLEKNNKTIIFFIDNLDRTQENHILFVYKAVASLLRINRIIYVLSFDRKTVYDSLKRLNIDSKYLKKIIQKRFDVPLNYGELNSVMITGLKKYCNLIDIDLKGLSDEEIYNIIEPFYDLRDYKIFLNQISHIFGSPLSKLNTFDLLAISQIKLESPKLAELIFENRQYFITEGLSEDITLSFYRYPEDKFENEAKLFFKENIEIEDFKKYIKLLKKLFPVLESYKKGYSKLYSAYSYDEKKSMKNKRISNARYFDIYFTDSINRCIIIDDIVEESFLSINQGSFNSDKQSQLVSLLRESDSHSTILILESMDNRLEDLRPEKFENLFWFLIENLSNLDDSFETFRFSGKRRAIFIISKILYAFDTGKFIELINKIGQINNLLLLRNIKYWISPEAEKIGQYSKEKYEILSKKISNLCTYIVENEIDLYEDNTYSRYNARVIEWEKNDNIEEITKYFNKVVNSNNISKYLYDYMQISSSNYGYGYKILIEQAHQLISKERINEMLNNIVDNYDNNFVKEVYEKTLTNDEKSLTEPIVLPKEIHLFNE